jgi:hypothetical protein
MCKWSWNGAATATAAGGDFVPGIVGNDCAGGCETAGTGNGGDDGKPL